MLSAAISLLAAGCSGSVGRATAPDAGTASDSGSAAYPGEAQDRGVAPTTTVLLPRPHELVVDGLLASMDTGELFGQLLMISFEQNDDGTPFTTMTEEAVESIGKIGPGGIILFSSNLGDVDQVTGLVRELQSASRVPLILATDHEGGLVSRLTASRDMRATIMPSATLVGIAAGVLLADEQPEKARELARSWGEAVGAELRALGLTMNLAPVADIAEEGSLMATQRRTFGSDADLVADLVTATIEGLRQAGVTAVVKHFPGQGAAVEDTHTTRIALAQDWKHAREVDLVPFVAAIAAGARAIMSAHISYPNLTGNDHPATTSPELLTGLLREEMGFDGIILTDALNMESVSRGASTFELAVAAIEAGADILLKPIDPEGLHTMLVEAANSGIVSRERIVISVRRILREKVAAGLFGPAPAWVSSDARSVVGAEEHQAVVDEIRATARLRRN